MTYESMSVIGSHDNESILEFANLLEVCDGEVKIKKDIISGI